MDYSYLTKEQAIDGIKNDTINFRNLSDELKDDKEVVLQAVESNINFLMYVSERLKNDKELLEIMEKFKLVILEINPYIGIVEHFEKIDWYEERMLVLDNIRKQEEKKIMENSIIPSDKINKKIKF